MYVETKRYEIKYHVILNIFDNNIIDYVKEALDFKARRVPQVLAITSGVTSNAILLQQISDNSHANHYIFRILIIYSLKRPLNSRNRVSTSHRSGHTSRNTWFTKTWQNKRRTLLHQQFENREGLRNLTFRSISFLDEINGDSPPSQDRRNNEETGCSFHSMQNS